MTYRIIKTEVPRGYLVIRTEPSGYELVWELCDTRAEAKMRQQFWTLHEQHR